MEDSQGRKEIWEAPSALHGPPFPGKGPPTRPQALTVPGSKRRLAQPQDLLLEVSKTHLGPEGSLWGHRSWCLVEAECPGGKEETPHASLEQLPTWKRPRSNFLGATTQPCLGQEGAKLPRDRQGEPISQKGKTAKEALPSPPQHQGCWNNCKRPLPCCAATRREFRRHGMTVL